MKRQSRNIAIRRKNPRPLFAGTHSNHSTTGVSRDRERGSDLPLVTMQNDLVAVTIRPNQGSMFWTRRVSDTQRRSTRWRNGFAWYPWGKTTPEHGLTRECQHADSLQSRAALAARRRSRWRLGNADFAQARMTPGMAVRRTARPPAFRVGRRVLSRSVRRSRRSRGVHSAAGPPPGSEILDAIVDAPPACRDRALSAPLGRPPAGCRARGTASAPQSSSSRRELEPRTRARPACRSRPGPPCARGGRRGRSGRRRRRRDGRCPCGGCRSGRVGEEGGIAVGRRRAAHMTGRSAGITLSPNARVLARDADRQQDRPVVAQAFLDGARRSARDRPAAARAGRDGASSARTPLPIRPIVVSKPAIRSPIDCESSSSCSAGRRLPPRGSGRSGCRRAACGGARRSGRSK